ncbi:hypothetical protein F4778DRAFT_229652 [Xylariomycetidae sp. FL2044]|nr:hypothetical protein F4778DRAFT_229652 [Xylariomycetidae sp. FL2044]
MSPTAPTGSDLSPRTLGTDDAIGRVDSVRSSKSGRSFLGSIIRKETKLSKGKDSPKGIYGLTTLHEPPAGLPVADLIFVHGLNGGSHSTWTKGNESNFWPSSWLPYDDAFTDVRIHTFGYHSSVSRESVLNIKDFSRSLLGAIYDSPSIPRKQHVPLIFVGHSMGGLVIKKAYVLGHQLPEFSSLVQKVCAMFFLGVPHQGAAIAQTLQRLLSLHGARPFVNDLLPSSSALESLNDEFPVLSKDLRLFSFFETRPMNYGIGNGLIVEKHAAVLNYPNERRTYLDANHRDVARFSSADDPSYLTVRNALATLIDEQRENTMISELMPVGENQVQDKVDTRSMDSLCKFLGVQDAPEDDLMILESFRLPGSCEWLIQRPAFTDWKDKLYSKVYWLRGRPGVGKSVISSFVISHLRELSRDCCFFFFVQGDKGKASIQSFLRSMAFQMAILHPEILHILLDTAKKWGETTLDKNDVSSLWRKLFISGILKVKLNRPQYWVIDAVDEVRDNVELTSFLSKAQEYWPICIFMTSRHSVDSHTGLLGFKMEVVSDNVTEEDNHEDIALFLEYNYERFPAQTTTARYEMAQRILNNSRGCFLWAQLVVKELLQVRTTIQANKVIDSNPSDMDALYINILQSMSESKFNRELVQAILAWVVCASRPLFIDELQEAIQMDIHDEIGDMETTISESCGNLVYVDKLRKVQLIHLTARELLMREDLDSEFSIDRQQTHRRLAMICIQYLSGPVMRPPKLSRWRKESIPTAQQHDTPFMDYALDSLFHHLTQAKACDDELLIALTGFFKSANLLGWIERTARRLNFQRLFQAGKAINIILKRRAEDSPPIGLQQERACLAQWANDLPRLVTKFGKRLGLSPSTIHHLIPAFCPPRSAVFKQFSNPRGLTVSSSSSSDWDDCLSTISYMKPARPHTLSTSSSSIALGMSTGTVVLYDQRTFQEISTLHHTEPVWASVLSEDGTMLAVACPRSIHIWNVHTGTRVRVLVVKAMCMALAFGDKDTVLWAALRDNMLLCWQVDNGDLRADPINWTMDFDEATSELHARAPVMATFCMSSGLLAVVYRGEDLILWELDEERIYDIYEKETGSRFNESLKQADGATTVWDVAFGVSPETNLLAAAYSDGDLLVYDLEKGDVASVLRAAYSQKLCCSSDGRTLASGDSMGNIQLFDFQTLKLLYKIQFVADALKIRTLSFTVDSLRLIEIRGSQCRLWEPSILLRQDVDDSVSDRDSVSTAPLEVEYETIRAHNITAMACFESSTFVFAGKEDGSVYVYDILRETQGQQLFIQTRNCPVTLLHFDAEDHILTCCDASTRTTARRLHLRSGDKWEPSTLLLDTRPASKVCQIIGSGKHGRLMISTTDHNTLWALEENKKAAHLQQIDGSDRPCWVQHLDNKSLILVEETGVRIYTWANLDHVATIPFASLDPPLTSSIIPLQHSRFFATISKDQASTTANSRSAIHVWDMRDFTVTETPEAVKPAFDLGTLVHSIEHVIGVVYDRLVFLDKDYWVCSIDLNYAGEHIFRRGITTGSVSLWDSKRRQSEASAVGEGGIEAGVVRHFFIPDDWISMVTKFKVDVGRKGEIIFVKRSELIVVQRGLEFSENGIFRGIGRGSSPTRGLPSRPTLRGFQRDRHSI